jgi:hypothetical protein
MRQCSARVRMRFVDRFKFAQRSLNQIVGELARFFVNDGSPSSFQ